MLWKLIKRTFYVVAGIFFALNCILIVHAYRFTHFKEIDIPGYLKWQKQKTTLFQKLEFMFLGADVYKMPETQPDTAFEHVLIQVNPNLTLDSWLIKPKQFFGTLILFHGYGCNKQTILNEAAAFRKMGYQTLLVDFRGHGKSSGTECSIGFFEAEDVKQAYDWVQTNYPKQPVVLYGISMGAVAVAKSVSDYNLQPNQVILEMPFQNLSCAVQGQVRKFEVPEFPFGNIMAFWGGAMQGMWSYDFDVLQYAKNIKSPTLLQWGKLGKRVKQSETENLYNSLSSPKKLVVYETAGHESLLTKEPTKWNYSVSTFLHEPEFFVAGNPHYKY